jgi:biopolymer transport protein ExbD
MDYFGRKIRKKPHIEIIPMIDVMLLLLVFYILSTLTLNQEKGIHVQLPQAKTGERDDSNNKAVVVTIDKDGKFYLNKTPVTPGGLPAAMRALAAQRPGGIADIQANPVVINADLSVQHRLVVEAMDALRGLDILRFSIATQPTHA